MFQAGFNPQKLDLNIRNQLADSLQYLFENVGSDLNIDLEQATPLLNKIQQYKISPSVFAVYYDLVFAIKANQLTIAQQLAQDLLVFIQEDAEFAILPYTKAALADNYERFPRLVFASYSSNNPMGSPDQDLFRDHLDKLQQAMDIIQAVDNAIYLEFKALVLQVIVTVNKQQDNGARSFGGASSFMTWGAIFINAQHYQSLYQVVEFYVHELTHCLLFGYSCLQPLVLNPVSESFVSPLRTDARPMDGIYHATLVCARLALFMKKWQIYGAVDDSHELWLNKQYQLYLQKFYDGASVIHKKAQLSKQGSLFLKEAESSLLKNR